jgi:hypothetical protein
MRKVTKAKARKPRAKKLNVKHQRSEYKNVPIRIDMSRTGYSNSTVKVGEEHTNLVDLGGHPRDRKELGHSMIPSRDNEMTIIDFIVTLAAGFILGAIIL